MNIYTGDLNALTVESVYDFCNDVHEENQRLEFKREIPSRKLAYVACSMANADGGIIIVGLEDLKDGGAAKFADNPPDIKPGSLTAIRSAVNAWVNPAVPIDIRGIGPNGEGRKLVIVRVLAKFRWPS